MSLIYSVNGLTLQNKVAGYQLMDSTQYGGTLTIRNTILTLPNFHGSVPVWNAPMESAQVQLKVRIHGADQDTLNTRWNGLIRRLGVGTNQPVTLARSRSVNGTTNGRVTTVAAQLVSVEPPDFSCVAGFLDTTLTFHIPEGRWFGAQAEESLSIPGQNQVVDLAAEGTLPMTAMQFKVKGPVSSFAVTDNVSNTGFSWSGASILSTQWLLIDLATYTAWQKTTNDYNNTGTNVSANLVSTNLGWLSLVPGVAPGFSTSDVSVSASGTSGATTCTLRTRPAYH